MNQLGFHIVGYGCTTCIGNSGDLDEAVASAITENGRHFLVLSACLNASHEIFLLLEYLSKKFFQNDEVVDLVHNSRYCSCSCIVWK